MKWSPESNSNPARPSDRTPLSPGAAEGEYDSPSAPGGSNGSTRIAASDGTIDRHYGHLARDGREHAIKLLDAFTSENGPDVHAVDVTWTLQQQVVAHREKMTNR